MSTFDTNYTIRPRRALNNWTSDMRQPVRGPRLFARGKHDNMVENLHTPEFRKQENVPKKPPKGIKRSILNHLEKYCENTTLHGLRYVGDSHLTFGERIFWFVAFSFAVAFASYYIGNIYIKWQSSPVIISFSPMDAELSTIPFPAITICNMNQAKKSEAEKILKYGTDIEKKLLEDSCNSNVTFDSTDKIGWETIRNFLIQVGSSCKDMLQSCRWGSEKIDCETIFNNDLTDEGLCCSFNRLPPQKIFRNMKDVSILNQSYPENVYDWNAEKGFKKGDYEDSIPRRPLGAGAHLGLSVVLNAQTNNYYCSSTRSTGFKAILSNPIETPKMADYGFFISPGFETRVTIEPSIREATDTLRDIPIGKRQCYFSNERPLQYYRNKCNCLSRCTIISYFFSKSSAPWYNYRRQLNKTQMTNLRENMAKADFFFGTVTYTKVEKRAIFDLTDYIASTGALLSLFTGFSFLSAVETVFHLVWIPCRDYFKTL